MPGNTSKRYPPEVRVRVVQMYHEIRPNCAGDWAAMGRVAKLVGVSSPETLRRWVRQDEIDHGKRPGVTSVEAAKIKRLMRENAALRRENTMLKAKSPSISRTRPARAVIIDFVCEHDE